MESTQQDWEAGPVAPEASNEGGAESGSPPTTDLTPGAVVDPNDLGFYFARVMQWILLHPEIPHTAVRVYGVFRALYTHRRDMRELSKDELRYLVPGVNGKPMGKTALNDALAVLAKFDLITNPDGRKVMWRLRDTESQQFVARSKFAWQLGTLPVDGDTFEGWRNVFDKLDAYPGPDWEKTTGQPHNRKSGPGVVHSPGSVDNDETAGQGHDRKSEGHDRKSGSGDRKSGHPQAPDQEKPGPNNRREEPPDNNEETGGRPPGPPDPVDADAPTGLNDQADHSAQVVSTELELVGDPQLERARKLAGPAACAAIKVDPSIPLHDLERIIAGSNANLTQLQVVGRAARLRAQERHHRHRAAG